MNNSYTAASSAKEMDNHFWLMTIMLLLVFVLQLAGIIDLKKPSSPLPLATTPAQTQAPQQDRYIE
ncbi:hypothetical protein [uncultured Hymenobacter sp.]|uniref:hypothetical protein n=1 Tax=uncultured Hymenobacter sp. TaxID=170016 RepID=UPI0035CC6C24